MSPDARHRAQDRALHGATAPVDGARATVGLDGAAPDAAARATAVLPRSAARGTAGTRPDDAVELSNTTVRALLLDRAALGEPCAARTTNDALLATIERLGMVQIDPLAPVMRAHDHLLWSRHADYRPARLHTLLARRRDVFEHFTHDAAVLPSSLWPWWARTRSRRADRYARGAWGDALPPAGEREAIVERIAREGPLCSGDFDGPRADRTVHAWMRPAHKIALEWLWLSGRLAVSHRAGVVKHYDLVERTLPARVLDEVRTEAEQVDRLCAMALERLGVATPGELQRFWEACTPQEVQAWLRANPERWYPVRVRRADGDTYRAVAAADTVDFVAPPARPRVRILNPFDPLVRDRARLSKVFGFEYRIEIYVPKHLRRYGWYVYPVLEGTRFVGRIEVRADRDADRLRVLRWWPEPGLRASAARHARIERELARFARGAGVTRVDSLPAPSSPPAS